MSLIMMINKIQDASDMDGFLRMPGWELDKIVQDSPMHVIDVMEVKDREGTDGNQEAAGGEPAFVLQRADGPACGIYLLPLPHAGL